MLVRCRSPDRRPFGDIFFKVFSGILEVAEKIAITVIDGVTDCSITPVCAPWKNI
jgi:hypothetical protein